MTFSVGVREVMEEVSLSGVEPEVMAVSAGDGGALGSGTRCVRMGVRYYTVVGFSFACKRFTAKYS